MIKVKVKPTSVIISGHAEYDDYGKDIVCSSVSSIVTTSVNAIMMFDEHTIDYKVRPGLLIIKILEENATTKKLIDNMLNLLESLSTDYPKNIKIERE